jgi:hypothetical protein
MQFGWTYLCRYGYFVEEGHVKCLCTNDTIHIVYDKVEIVGHILSTYVYNNEAEDQSFLECYTIRWVSGSWRDLRSSGILHSVDW